MLDRWPDTEESMEFWVEGSYSQAKSGGGVERRSREREGGKAADDQRKTWSASMGMMLGRNDTQAWEVMIMILEEEVISLIKV